MSKDEQPTKKVKTEEPEDQFIKMVTRGDYIDKTRFIEQLETINLTKNCIVSFRPRRFGKSITIAMLKNYYDLKTSNDIFNDLYIGKNPTKRAHQYLVLDFDFSLDSYVYTFNQRITLNTYLYTRGKEAINLGYIVVYAFMIGVTILHE